MLNAQLKKGSAELLVLSVLEQEPHHGYEIGKLIEGRSGGTLRFQASSLYPILCRLDERGLIAGRWVEQPGKRRRRFYRLTPKGVRKLTAARETWHEFAGAMNQVLGWDHA
ncbi:PadR family transcriptional regulator [Gemmatimonadota bacterium]